MTPEEKAKELVLSYRAFLSGAGINEKMSNPFAQKISLITCNEVLEQNDKIKEQNHIWWRDEKEYWESVKQHIQSL